MDKLLLAAFLSSLAGFITAVISVVKLVNEKENKTSEFRQAWINSVRASISDLAAKMTSMTANFEYQARLGALEKLQSSKVGDENIKRAERTRDAIAKNSEDIILKRHDMFQAYALCKLHFKPDEVDFKPIEDRFEKAVDEIKAIYKSSDHAERNKIKDKNYALIQEVVEEGRKILKNEWDRVKEGEKAYKITKKYSFRGGVSLLVLIVCIGLYAIYSIAKSNDNTSSTKVENALMASQCWQLQSINKRTYKLNTCSGEVSELEMVKVKKSELKGPGSK